MYFFSLKRLFNSEGKLILVNEDRDGMDKTPRTSIRTATCSIFIKKALETNCCTEN